MSCKIAINQMIYVFVFDKSLRLQCVMSIIRNHPEKIRFFLLITNKKSFLSLVKKNSIQEENFPESFLSMKYRRNYKKEPENLINIVDQ